MIMANYSFVVDDEESWVAGVACAEKPASLPELMVSCGTKRRRDWSAEVSNMHKLARPHLSAITFYAVKSSSALYMSNGSGAAQALL